MPPTPPRRSYGRRIGALVVAVISLVLVFLFVTVIIRDPSMASAWVGLVCFAFAAVGAIVTMEIDRRNPR
ncbi:hypothetical protein FB562_0724 [Homoserinimonas aerilata]|uniref:Uncharacterized protein n=1 Tax=Homoserinimonas aerilata TaxID=1162970 RepID=A0A542YHY6_9MICO|nr:hypothetical protein [Homoserinimonas aerilata]TQL47658.1 hypothetical protein FB562_0724 [Homoserinimonas aerilata]